MPRSDRWRGAGSLGVQEEGQKYSNNSSKDLPWRVSLLLLINHIKRSGGWILWNVSACNASVAVNLRLQGAKSKCLTPACRAESQITKKKKGAPTVFV